MMNFMAFYHRKYIIGVTLGCMIANLYSFGIVDVLLVVVHPLVFDLGVILLKNLNQYILNNLIRLDHFCFAILFLFPCLPLLRNCTSYKVFLSSLGLRQPLENLFLC